MLLVKSANDKSINPFTQEILKWNLLCYNSAMSPAANKDAKQISKAIAIHADFDESHLVLVDGFGV